ncbi:hypothetical protein GGR50DRAFT_119343 [Xylaria sp. CBS 124048]|nr:hypothetical protein GGR50DRAFT_119343 [Xylaria sp. CBS 124048]
MLMTEKLSRSVSLSLSLSLSLCFCLSLSYQFRIRMICGSPKLIRGPCDDNKTLHTCFPPYCLSPIQLKDNSRVNCPTYNTYLTLDNYLLCTYISTGISKLYTYGLAAVAIE